jgi:hypothetical protein
MICTATEAAGGHAASTAASTGSVTLEDGRDVDMTPAVTGTGQRNTLFGEGVRFRDFFSAFPSLPADAYHSS